ncbi:MAG TPA: VOC family protein [Acidimicrobiia bacterium]|nr:VOC family protein [Acidimicrobiia bacterium]
MTAIQPDSFTPRLNHVAIRMDPVQLDERGRAEILDFYGDVFGWTEGDNTGERGNPLILYTGTFGQFVYLAMGEPGATTGTVDHFGLQVATVEELEAIVARARARAEQDDRVRVSEVGSRTTHGPAADYTLTSVYISFVLPLSIELQHIARH